MSPGPAGRPPLGARLEAWRGPLRLASGLTLLTFLTTHFLNHALGLVSRGGEGQASSRVPS